MESSENLLRGAAASEPPAPSAMPPIESEAEPGAEETQKPAEQAGEQDGAAGVAEAPQGQGEEIATVEELLEHFELDASYFEGLEVTRRINGVDKTYRIGEILDGADKVNAADEYLAETRAKAKAITAEAEQHKNALGENVVVFGKLLEQVESRLSEDRKNINWAELREKDPAEHAALKQEMRDREDELKSIKEQAQASYRTALQQAEKQQEAALKARLPKEREILLEKLPDWGEDTDKADAEARDLVTFLADEGYSKEEMKFVMYNGRDLSMAVRAMRYDRIKDNASAQEKRVRKVPRILKPGADKGGDSKANEKPKDRAEILYG